jgi:hypothetical protein
MKKNVFFLFLLFSLASFAQGEANVWYFGEKAGEWADNHGISGTQLIG